MDKTTSDFRNAMRPILAGETRRIARRNNIIYGPNFTPINYNEIDIKFWKANKRTESSKYHTKAREIYPEFLPDEVFVACFVYTKHNCYGYTTSKHYELITNYGLVILCDDYYEKKNIIYTCKDFSVAMPDIYVALLQNLNPNRHGETAESLMTTIKESVSSGQYF